MTGEPAEKEKLAEETDSERRIAVRHFACFPVHIDDGVHRKRTAVIRDLSIQGTLLFTRASLSVGDRVSLNLYLSADTSAAIPASGRVVRFETRSRELISMWPHSVAVQFDTPLTEHEEAIKRVAEHQAELGLTPAT